MDKIKNQLAGVAALLGVIAAIGGGFVKYGEVMTKLEVLEAKESADYSSQIAVLEEKVEALSAQHGHTKILVNEKQIELLQVQIEEIKVSTSNPLAN